MAQDEAFELEGAGMKARARGPSATLAILIVTCFAGMAFFGWQHHQAMMMDHEQTKQEFSEMVYVLSLTPEERARLNLAMPESLRRKVRRDDSR